MVINSSGLNRTADTNRKYFFFIWWKGSYRKPSHVGQEAEVTEDRDRTASGGLCASGGGGVDALLLQRIVTTLIP